MRRPLTPMLNWIRERIHRRSILIAILILSFVLRLTVALVLPLDYRYERDAVEYVSVANNLLDHGVFGESADQPYAVIPPGYPLFIASVFALTGRSLMAVRLAQAILSVAIVWLTYLIGKETFTPSVGLGAAVLCALYPPFIMYVPPYLTETFYTALTLAFILCLMKSFEANKFIPLAGLTFGLTMLTREALIIFPLAFPFLFLWKKVPFKQCVRYLAIFCGVALLTLSPWLARNYLEFGRVFYTERTDAILYKITGIGYISSQYDSWIQEREVPVSESDDLYEYYLEYGRTSDLWNPRFALDNPGDYARYVVNRLREFWLHPGGLWSLPDIGVIRILYTIAHISLLALAIWQLVVLLRRHHNAAVTFAFLIINITLVGVFFRRPNPRYNLPFLPIVFILAVRGALALIGRFAPRALLPARHREL